jgi:hypothetical protein
MRDGFDGREMATETNTPSRRNVASRIACSQVVDRLNAIDQPIPLLTD